MRFNRSNMTTNLLVILNLNLSNFLCKKVTAVAPVVIKGRGQWVGWPGMHLPSDFDDKLIPESNPSDQTPTAGLKSEQVYFKLLLLQSQFLIILMAFSFPHIF